MSGINGTTGQLDSEIPLSQQPTRAQLRVAVLVLICANITCAIFMILRTIIYTRKDRRRISSITYSSEFSMPRPVVLCKCWWFWLARQRPFETDDVFPVCLSFGTIVQGIMLLWVTARALNGAAPGNCGYASEVAWTAIWITPFITFVFLIECMVRAISTPRLKPRGDKTVPICFGFVFFMLILAWIPTRVMDVPEDEFCNGQLMSYLNQFSAGGTALIAILIPAMFFLVLVILMHLFKDPEVSEKERTSASKTVYFSICTIVQWIFIIPFFATASMTSFPAAPVFIASVFLNLSGIWVSTLSLYIRANLAKVTIKPHKRWSNLGKSRVSAPPPPPEKDDNYKPSPVMQQVERVQPNAFPYNITANESTIRINIDPLGSPRTPRRPIPQPIQTARVVRYTDTQAAHVRNISSATTISFTQSTHSSPTVDPTRISGRTLISSTDYSIHNHGLPPRKSQLFSPVSAISSTSAASAQAFSFVDTPRHFFGPISPMGLPASPSSYRTTRSTPTNRPPHQTPTHPYHTRQDSHARTDSSSSTTSQTTLLAPRIILPRAQTTTTPPQSHSNHARSHSASSLNKNQTVVSVPGPRLQVPSYYFRRESVESGTLPDRFARESTATVGTLPIMLGDVERGEFLGREERREGAAAREGGERRRGIERDESFKEVKRWTREFEGGAGGGWI